MEFLIPIVLVLLIVAGAVTFGVLRATKSSQPSSAENAGDERSPDDLLAPDPSPLGDTAEHSDAQHEEGKAAPTGGSDTPDASASSGGGEGGEDPEPPDTRPESERLANRRR